MPRKNSNTPEVEFAAGDGLIDRRWKAPGFYEISGLA